MKVQDKVIVVTGGGSGIGQQIVLALLKKSAVVAAVDINLEALRETQKLAGVTLHRLSIHKTDISSRESVSNLVEEVLERHGRVDGIINNAGVIHPFKSVNMLDYSVIEKMMNVNFYGVINMTKAFLPLLLARPIAHIVNVSSMGGLFAFPNQTFYGASKAAVKLLSEGLHAELRNTKVGVTVVFPGATNTNITKNSDAHSEKIEQLSQKFRGTSAETVAKAIIDGMEKQRFHVLVGADAKILSVLYRMFPRLTISLIGRVMNMVLSD